MKNTDKLTLENKILSLPLLVVCCMCHMLYWFVYFKIRLAKLGVAQLLCKGV